MKKILLFFTGGTICSAPDGEGGKRQSDARKTGSLLERTFFASNSPARGGVTFERRFPAQDILSENMTVSTWEELLRILRAPEARTDHDGVVILHGTDTLAYTAALLSVALRGFPIPICLVSAQHDLNHPQTNGHENFRCAVELIEGGIVPNVYAVYQNPSNGEMLVHLGAHLMQCADFTDDFHSRDEMRVSYGEKGAVLSGRQWQDDSLYIDRIRNLNGSVLLIRPYTNLSYRGLRLRGVRAVVHGTYHTESVCIGRAKNPDGNKKRSLRLREVAKEDRPFSILTLLARCRRRQIPVILAPCDGESAFYGTTKNALDEGAVGLSRTTLELAYAKSLIGVSLGLRGKALADFLRENDTTKNF